MSVYNLSDFVNLFDNFYFHYFVNVFVIYIEKSLTFQLHLKSLIVM